jgi:predicted dehydrogenase
VSPLPPIRLGLAGCGRLAEAGYVPALAGLPGVELVAVADPDEGRRAAVGTDLPGYRDAGELVAAEALDGLVIASPVAAHLTDAEAAAAASLVALVEKPPAPDAAGATALAALDPAPVIGFNRRFDVAALAARATVDPSAPVELDLVLRYRRTGWAPVSVHDDALLDLGPHLVDWARWISHREVTSVERAELSATRAVVELTLAGAGGRARLEASADQPHTESIEVRQGGTLVSSHQVGGTVDGLKAKLLRSGRPDLLVTTLRGELAAYVALLRTGDRGALATPADGVAAMTVIDAARDAARERS